MILEGLVTTSNADGTTNVSPMGAIVDADMSVLRLRPFQTSRTYQNLQRHPEGVFHVVDDVLLLARAAIDRVDDVPETFPCERVRGHVLANACRWYEFRAEKVSDQERRGLFVARILYRGRLRDFFGFNRARHAVIEAAILASRIHLLAYPEIAGPFAAWDEVVAKTGGAAEREAFEILQKYVAEYYGVD